MSAKPPFWEEKPLGKLTRSEWESLCDGCGRCCLVKFVAPRSGRVDYTDVACRLLDCRSCRCSDYAHRQKQVPDCVKLTPEMAGKQLFTWLPETCAYRRLDEGKALLWWHPLVSGDPETVHRAGISVRDRVISETEVSEAEAEDRVVKWPLNGKTHQPRLQPAEKPAPKRAAKKKPASAKAKAARA